MDKILTILKLIPAIIAIVTSLETAIPVGGQGKIKLDAVKQFLLATSESLSDIWPAIEKIVAVIVSTLKLVSGSSPDSSAK